MSGGKQSHFLSPRMQAWARRMQLGSGLVYVWLLATQPWSWAYLALGVMLLGQALLMPGPMFFRALAAEKERKALGEGEG